MPPSMEEAFGLPRGMADLIGSGAEPKMPPWTEEAFGFARAEGSGARGADSLVQSNECASLLTMGAPAAVAVSLFTFGAAGACVTARSTCV